jgi:hypothetical protein
VNRPDPVRVDVAEFNLTLPVTVGLFPTGIVQLVPIVLFAISECVKVTKLKTTLLQVKVASAVPSKFIVPLLWLNVGDPEIVSAADRDIIPDGALNTPPVIVRILFRSAPLGRVKVPDDKVIAPFDTNEE